jgi:hypothetical protein
MAIFRHWDVLGEISAELHRDSCGFLSIFIACVTLNKFKKWLNIGESRSVL